MQSILEKGKEILEWEEKRPSLILRPQSDIREVRIFLLEHAYHIVQEKMLIDDGKYYTVIKAEPGKERKKYGETELQYGLYNLEHCDDVLCKYLKKEKQVLNHLLEKLTAIVEEAERTGVTVSEKTVKRRDLIRKEKERNRRALEYYVNLEGYI